MTKKKKKTEHKKQKTEVKKVESEKKSSKKKEGREHKKKTAVHKRHLSPLFVRLIIGALCLCLIGGAVAHILTVKELDKNIASITGQNASQAQTIDFLHVQLEDTEDLLTKTQRKADGYLALVRVLRTQVDDFEDQREEFESLNNILQGASKMASDLKKIRETDEEILAKYSKVYFLNEHYVPSDLTNIRSKWQANGTTLQIKKKVSTFLYDMLEAMRNDNLNPRVLSAYRSFEYQLGLKEEYIKQHGADADTFSADQGFSEHQLGSTIDMVSKGGELEEFEATAEYQWLLKNAHTYGFTLSYPENNSYYTFEPWHWRFVGIDLASDMRDDGQHFYDLSQRDINAYIVKLFDQ